MLLSRAMNECMNASVTHIGSVHVPPGQSGRSPGCGTTSLNCQSDGSENDEVVINLKSHQIKPPILIFKLMLIQTRL